MTDFIIKKSVIILIYLYIMNYFLEIKLFVADIAA